MKKTLFLFIILLGFISLNAQNNPFSELGYEPKIATLSQGKYIESFDNDTIVQIGSVLFNTITQQIVAFVKTDTIYSETTLEPDVVSRWISPDPLEHEYVSWSPYNFVVNNPIRSIDPDGRDVIVLNNPKGASGYGHMAILVGNNKTGWTFISKEGRDKTAWYSNIVTGGPALKPKIQTFTSLEAFQKAQKIDSDLAAYTESIRFKTTEEEDETVRKVVTESAKSWYNVAFSNCADACSDGLESIGLDPGNAVDSYAIIPIKAKPAKPNDRFKYIKKNNSIINSDKIIPTYPSNDEKNTKPENKETKTNDIEENTTTGG